MYGFAILMFCLAGGLLLYAALLAKEKDPTLIPRNYAAKMKDRRAYARQFARVIALVAAAPALSGLIALLTDAALPTLLALVGGLVVCLWLGARWMKKAQ